jgi:hypothetical protein
MIQTTTVLVALIAAEVKSGEASTAKSVASGREAAALGGNGATYAPGQEAKKPTCASVITNQC